MRLNRVLPAVAVLLLVVGAVLLVLGSRTEEVGWFAYAPLSDTEALSASFGGTPWQVTAGWAALWLGTLLAAGLVGTMVGRRRAASA